MCPVPNPGGKIMLDIVFLALGLGGFLICLGYAALIERL